MKRTAAAVAAALLFSTLGGCAAVEQAAGESGSDVEVRFAPGRTDASQATADLPKDKNARAKELLKRRQQSA